MHPLEKKYPDNFVMVTTFGEQTPDVLGKRQAYSHIDRINRGTASPEIRRIFRKRFGRWYIHIPSLVEYMDG